MPAHYAFWSGVMIGSVREVSAEQMVIKLALGFLSFAESAKQNSFTVCVGLRSQIPKSLVKRCTVIKKKKKYLIPVK